MKTTTILSLLALAVTAFADPTPVDPPTKVERDLPLITSVMSQVTDAMNQLDSSVNGFNGDMGNFQSDSDNLITILKLGTTTVGASAISAVVTTPDATGLQAIVAALQSAGQTLMNDLTGKRAQFQDAGQCMAVQSSIGDIAANSKSFLDSVVSKCPPEVQSIAASFASSFDATINQGVNAFSPDNCANSPGATTTDTTDTTSSTTATGTGTSTTTFTVTSGTTYTSTRTLTFGTATTTGTGTVSTSTSTSTTTITSARTYTSTRTYTSGTTTRTSTFTTTSFTTSTSTGTSRSTTTRSTTTNTGGAALPTLVIGPIGAVAGMVAVLML